MTRSGARLRGQSLRRRLVVGVVAALALGIVGFAAVTYTALRAFIQDRTDGDAIATAHAAAVAIRATLAPAHPGDTAGGTPGGAAGAASGAGRAAKVRARLAGPVTLRPGDRVEVARELAFSLSPGDAAVLRVAGHTVVAAVGRSPHGRASASAAVLHALGGYHSADVDGHIPQLGNLSAGTVGYRVVVVRPRRVPGALLLVAIPTSTSASTLHRLLLIETAAGAVLLLLLGGFAFGLVRTGLRPLDAIAETAVAITAGERTRRVPLADAETEIGRVSRVLNRMLEENEAALAAREGSEARLRRFVADASHELRTPLASIRSYADLLASGAAETPGERQLALDRIRSESVRMTRLVDDLLLLARLDSGRPLAREPVDLARVAADAVADAQAVDPGRPTRLVAAGAVVVAGDPDRLHQLVTNLLTNARQHTPAGTPVEVTVGRDRGFALLAVRDRGPGIPGDRTERIFDRFARLDPSRHRRAGGSGVGLGLAIVAAIVRAHEGGVEVVNPAGGGAEFRVRLPVAGDPAGRPPAAQPRAAAAGGTGRGRGPGEGRPAAEPARAPAAPAAPAARAVASGRTGGR